MLGVVDRWNDRDLSGIVIKVDGEGESWFNCNPMILDAFLKRGGKKDSRIYFECSDRYKKKLIKLFFEEEYKRVNEQKSLSLPGKVVIYDDEIIIEETHEEKLLILLERIAVALEYQNKIYKGN